MSKTALLTSGRKLSGNEGSFLLSVYDLEPAGIVVTAYNQVNSKEYSLPISEMELATAGISRQPESLKILLETIELVAQEKSYILSSSMGNVGKLLPRSASDNLEASVKGPSLADNRSLQDLLVEGLVELCKVKPNGLDAVEWLGNWLLDNNPNKPSVDIGDDE